MSKSSIKGYTYQVEYSILNFIQYLNMFLFVYLLSSISIGNNKKNTYIVKKIEIVV